MNKNNGKIIITEYKGISCAFLINNNHIIDLAINDAPQNQLGNIYIGRVNSVIKNLDACFVDLGNKNYAFLPLKDTVSDVKCERPVCVQYIREPIKSKSPGVTGKISLSGKYCVVILDNNNELKFSRKLSDLEREAYKSNSGLLSLIEKYTIMIRSNAAFAPSEDDVINEAITLAAKLDGIIDSSKTRSLYSVLYKNENKIIEFIKNTYVNEYDEIVTDIDEEYKNISNCDYVDKTKIRLYNDELLPLSKLYSIESKIEELLNKNVWLKSGGYIVIEPTESLISIDVNTGKYETGKDKESAALKVNLEACDEIARQIRARNLSGMIIVDFINVNKNNTGKVYDYLNSLLKKDKLQCRLVDITGLGLFEITRKKQNKPIYEIFA